MNDPWLHILRSLEPELDRLTEMLVAGPYSKPELWKNSHGKWAVTIQEVWNDNTISDVNLSVNFNNCIIWTEEELKKWECKRTSYDTWVFKSKRNAEKFITLFLLQWPN